MKNVSVREKRGFKGFTKPSFIIHKIDFLTKNCHFSLVILNPFTLRAAKTGLTILEIFIQQKHFLENI